ncbi:hypothetical protein BJX68DRAFT_263868 [Aspergillus pseudodeflectus]|uniref:SNF2 N-terminal domain-containing protein n=1 Tax=Aspergillus pseudodeflectus TaxID=176178 RepID=A0ABR4KVT7_9EURO
MYLAWLVDPVKLDDAVLRRYTRQCTRSCAICRERSTDSGSLVYYLGESLSVVRALLVGPDGFLKHDVRQRLRHDKADAQGGVAGSPGLNEETSQGDALAATEDDVLTGTDAVDQSDLKRVSESLNIDPATRELKMGEDMTFQLKAYQVTGIACVKEQERGPIKGRILADDCGLGKII